MAAHKINSHFFIKFAYVKIIFTFVQQKYCAGKATFCNIYCLRNVNKY
jgi:hypothetical protein